MTRKRENVLIVSFFWVSRRRFLWNFSPEYEGVHSKQYVYGCLLQYHLRLVQSGIQIVYRPQARWAYILISLKHHLLKLDRLSYSLMVTLFVWVPPVILVFSPCQQLLINLLAGS
jgi:hypothetical protein